MTFESAEKARKKPENLEHLFLQETDTQKLVLLIKIANNSGDSVF